MGSRSLRLLVAAAAVVVVIAGLRAFSGSIGPAFLALVLVIVVHPLGARIQRLGASPWVPQWVATWTGVAANLVVVYLIVAALAASLAWAAVELATTLPQYVDQLIELRDEFLAFITGLGFDQAELIRMINSANPYDLLGYAQTLVSGLASGLTDFAFVLLLLFFLVLDAAPFPKLLDQASELHRDAVESIRTFASGTRRYLVVSTVFGAIVAVLDVVALVWLGVPLALLWGLVSFVTNYVANIGFLLGVAPPALLALLANGPENALLVIVIYTAINVVIQGLIQPKIVGNAVGLSATLTFLSVVFWGFVLGGLGALLAVPLSLLARAVLIDADPRARWMLPLVAGSTRGVPVRRPSLPHVHLPHVHRPHLPQRHPSPAPVPVTTSTTGTAASAPAAPTPVERDEPVEYPDGVELSEPGEQPSPTWAAAEWTGRPGEQSWPPDQPAAPEEPTGRRAALARRLRSAAGRRPR
ncbi:AI-2E family transporter [Quadrisphaera granulorum]|uniref:AI-2E family transporter n=1 Tax=Quadrisphaera granulorum TaxID=317664 RepID=UPI000D6B4CBE|nr:AI-2E family transporter [Quadrisphaera granulorum]